MGVGLWGWKNCSDYLQTPALRGSADFIIIDGPLKPDEALSERQRRAVNEWFDYTLCSRPVGW